MYVLPPSLFFFFLFRAKIERFFYLHLHISKMCTLYYLFRENSAYNTHSKLVRSLEVRLEVKSLCGTSTDVSKLVCSYFNRKETRVFIHPRSNGQCRPIAWKFSFQKLKIGTSTKYVLERSRLKSTGNLDENLKSLNQFLSILSLALTPVLMLVVQKAHT